MSEKIEDAAKRYENFVAFVRELEGIANSIQSALRIPEYKVGALGRIKIYEDHSYSRPTEDGTQAVRVLTDIAKAEMRRLGEIERDEKLAVLTAKLSCLRATLPSRAAEASTALMEIGRDAMLKARLP